MLERIVFLGINVGDKLIKPDKRCWRSNGFRVAVLCVMQWWLFEGASFKPKKYKAFVSSPMKH